MRLVMRLSNKVLITLAVCWFAFLGISYFVAEYFLLNSFLVLERNQINTNINRAKQALNQIMYSLGTFTVDWAHWNDAYDYIRGVNPQFIPNNIDFSALTNSNINLLIYLNKQGDILIGVPFNIENKKQIPYPLGLDKYIYPGSLLENHVDAKSQNHGLILLPTGIMLIASAGVSTTDMSEPMNGTLITGRYFSQRLLQILSNATSLPLALYTSSYIKTNKKMNKIYNQILNNKKDKNSQYISIENNSLAYGYTVLYDIFEEPIGMIRVTVPRAIFKTGKEAIDFYLGIFIVTGIVFSIIVWFLLRFLVLKRLEFLNKEIKEIGGKKDFNRNIEMKEQDELASVAKEFNDLMHTINVSHEQLKRQVREITLSEKKLEASNTKLVLEIHERKQMQLKVEALHKELILAARRAGMADIASGVLHNVGNILNNVTTSVGVAKEMVESSRAKKLDDLAKMLEGNKDNLVDFLTKDARGTKILEYIRMLANSLIDENKNMEKEVCNLDKYIGHIKEVVTMQQSLSNVIGMNEELKIADIIEDARMLNKSISENKEIEFTYDIQLKENVILDRVKLLHVIVNLIKNAIESILEANPPEKHIWIKVFQKDETFFRIEVKDNGLGISADNLTNIFNYGFTTKQSGNGIGLHTSSSFIQEMGGKLYATNNESGPGATFIIELALHPRKENT
jgi:sensor domain CHASE-containing protein